ncbi:cation/H(+) antiporter 28 [Typha latifolia]|uniref:cation/H(+) antiporter 28 n=1 Tax=Typha latifolia TaxID=4733 RepID=UPI003C2F008C
MSSAAQFNLTQQEEQECAMRRSTLTAAYSIFLAHLVFILISGKLLHLILRRLFQPRFVSDLLIALLIGKVDVLRDSFRDNILFILNVMGTSCLGSYLLTLGLEMDPLSVFEYPGPEALIGFASLLSTTFITPVFYRILVVPKVGILQVDTLPVVLGLTAALANTSSPILTRLIAELKISKTAVGRLAINAGITIDIVSTFFMCFGTMLWHVNDKNQSHLFYILGISGEMLFTVVLIRPMFMWINERNPEGKEMKGIDTLVVMLTVFLLCSIGSWFNLDINMTAFLVGLALPKEGRVTRVLINNINVILSSLMFPLYLCYICLSLRYDEIEDAYSDGLNRDYVMDTSLSLQCLFTISTIAVLGKVMGPLIAGLLLGLNWLEALAIGLLLNVKGHYHLFCAYQAMDMKFISDKSFLVLLFMILGTAVITPLVGFTIATWARRRMQRRLVGLQFHNQETELRIIVGLHGGHNMPRMINVIEALRWGTGPGELIVYATDMVELTERAAASLVKGEGMDVVAVSDESIVEMRRQIEEALEVYQLQSGEGVKVRRLLAISSFPDMHRDICRCAEDVMAALIILPFHKSQRTDGSMDAGHAGFRQVNQKVFQHATCSVGILIDRGLGQPSRISTSNAIQNLAVLFIGGPDDREALTLAVRMSRHPGIRLTVIRFLPDTTAHARACARMKVGHRILVAASQEEMQMQADDEYFTKFYQRYVLNEEVGYMEKHVGGGAELVVTLQSLEGQYQLIVVGRGKERNSVLTDGLADWAELPELGPVGDILASSDFSVTASVLIVQQHDTRKQFKVIDEEFMPF